MVASTTGLKPGVNEKTFGGKPVPTIREGKRVLIAAHGNSLRALVKHLEEVSDQGIAGLDITTGVPYVLTR